jgi:hypothetical protein
MYRLLYYYGGQLSESYEFPSEALANWKARELFRLGTHRLGHFVIQKI